MSDRYKAAPKAKAKNKSDLAPIVIQRANELGLADHNRSLEPTLRRASAFGATLRCALERTRGKISLDNFEKAICSSAKRLVI
jgi:hypothetical protein